MVQPPVVASSRAVDTPDTSVFTLLADFVVAAMGVMWTAMGAVPIAILFFSISVGLLYSMQRLADLEMPGAGATVLAGMLLFSRAIVPEMMQKGLAGRTVGERLRGLAGLLSGVFFYAGVVAPKLYAGSRWGAIAVEVIFKVDLWLPRLGVVDPSAAVDTFMRVLGISSLLFTVAAAHSWRLPVDEDDEASNTSESSIAAQAHFPASNTTADAVAASGPNLRRRAD